MLSTAVDGGSWFALLARLHPVVLHVPIGVLFATLLVEVLGVFPRARHPGMRRALWWFTAISALFTAVTGWLLADHGGSSGTLVERHRFLGSLFAITALGTALIGSFARAPGWGTVLRLGGALGCATLAFATGHAGGALVHGRDFLSRGTPAWYAERITELDEWLLPPLERTTPQAASDGAAVFDVFARHCIECHGPDKQKADLRLDRIEDIELLVDPGVVVESELARRLLLPRSDDEAMPPDDELDPLEVMTVLRWIRDGAKLELIDTAARTAAKTRANAAADRDAIASAAGAILRDVPGAPGILRADFARSDTEPVLAALAPLADRITELSLAGRSLAPDATDDLPTFAALQRLHVERSSIDDAAIARLVAAAPELRSVNAHSTAITAHSLDAFAKLSKLERLVLFETPIPPEALSTFRAAHPKVDVTAAAELPPVVPPERARRRILAADASERRVALLREVAIGRYETLWQREIDQIHDLHALPNGHVLLQDSFTRLLEVDPETDEVVWSYDAASQNRVAGRFEIHAFGRIDAERTFVAESGPARILEVDRSGAQQHAIALRVDHSDPHHDTRLVRRTADDTYLVAHERDGVVREYDRNGAIVWEYAVPLFGREPAPGHGPEAWGNQVFAALRQPDGNTLITTGNGHRVLEVSRASEIVWQLGPDDLPGIELAWVTTVQVLRDGNLVIGNCHAGEHEPQLIEVTRDKQVVWTFRDFERFGNALSNSVVLEGER